MNTLTSGHTCIPHAYKGLRETVPGGNSHGSIQTVPHRLLFWNTWYMCYFEILGNIGGIKPTWMMQTSLGRAGSGWLSFLPAYQDMNTLFPQTPTATEPPHQALLTVLDWTPLRFQAFLTEVASIRYLVMATSQVIQYGNNEDEHNTGLFASFNTKRVPDMKITGFSKQNSVFTTHNPRTSHCIRELHLDITVPTIVFLGGSKRDLKVDEGSRRYATRKIMLAYCWLWIPRTMLANRAKGYRQLLGMELVSPGDLRDGMRPHETHTTLEQQRV